MGIRKFAAFLLVITIIGSAFLSGCGGNKADSANTPEKTLKEMEEAFNKSDIEGLLNCYEPSVRAMYEGMMSLFGGISGLDMNTLIQGMAGFSSLIVEGEKASLKIKVNNKQELSDEKVQLNVTMTSKAVGTSNELTDDITMKKIDDKWYIAMEMPTDSIGSEPSPNQENQSGEDGGYDEPVQTVKVSPASDFKISKASYGVYIEEYIGPAQELIIVPTEIEGLPVVCAAQDAFPSIGENILPAVFIDIPNEYGVSETKLPFEIPASSLEYVVKNDEIIIIKFPDIISYTDIPCFIPRNIEGKNVGTIGEQSFNGLGASIIYIPDTVHTIMEGGFANTKRLNEIVLGAGVKNIAYNAFKDSVMQKINLPEGLEKIESYAFNYCRNLIHVELPMSLTALEMDSFFGAGQLLIKVIPGSPAEEYIMSMMPFAHLRSFMALQYYIAETNGIYFINAEGGLSVTRIPDKTLENIVIPSIVDGKKVVGIENNVIRDCPDLKSIELPDSLVYIGEMNLIDTSLTTIVFPEGIKKIADYTCYNSPKLTDVFIPASVEEIGGGLVGSAAFDGSYVTITTPAGSYAEQWAIKYNRDYKNADKPSF